MRLIFIRHAEPNYAEHTLTEKGFREARILADRITTWEVDRFYTSPLARAQLTLAPALERLGRTAETVDWMQEFSYYVTDPTTGHAKVPWDFMPEYWTAQTQFYDPNDFYKHELFMSNPDHEPAVLAMRNGLDGILEAHGLIRTGAYYRRDTDTAPNAPADHSPTFVIAGHLGANFHAIGYLLGIAPPVLQQSIFLAPTAISILQADERQPGHVIFRAQVIGDTAHLREAGEPLSQMGAFSPVFNG